MRKILLWGLVVIWAGTIFYLSSIPNLRVSASNYWDEILRSGAHIFFYALGYWLFFRAINFGQKKKSYWLPFWLVCFYGLSDEFHQTFVPTRSFQFQDLLVDFGGAGLGMVIRKVVVDKIGYRLL